MFIAFFLHATESLPSIEEKISHHLNELDCLSHIRPGSWTYELHQRKLALKNEKSYFKQNSEGGILDPQLNALLNSIQEMRKKTRSELQDNSSSNKEQVLRDLENFKSNLDVQKATIESEIQKSHEELAQRFDESDYRAVLLKSAQKIFKNYIQTFLHLWK